MWNAALTITKSPNTSTYDHEGQVIEYTYIVKNIGKVGISTLNVYDNKTTAKIALNRSYLYPGKVAKGTFKYTIKPSDITNGFVTNKAYATGTYNGKTVNSNEATATVTSTAKPPDTSIPEFPSIAIPVAAVLGIMFISQRRRKEK